MTVEKNNKLIQSYNSTQSTKALDSSTMTRDTALIQDTSIIRSFLLFSFYSVIEFSQDVTTNLNSGTQCTIN